MSRELPYGEELEFALDCARRAGEQIRAIDRTGFEVEYKAGGSPVTTADREINRWFIEQVTDRFPDDGVLGEEQCRETGGSRTWVIDPLDGTRQFLLRIPVWMVAIALTDESGRPVVGVAHNPLVHESAGSIYWATDGGGAYRDGMPIRVSTRGAAGEAAWIRGEAATRRSSGLSGTLLEVALEADTKVIEHRALPAVFACCLVAEGSLDGVLFTAGGAHDLAAACVLVREAGGWVTDLSGADQRYDGEINGGVLSNRLIHDGLLRRRSGSGS